MNVIIAPGFSPAQRLTAAELFWQAFSAKLGMLMRPENRALQFLDAVLDPTHAISASAEDGTLLGIAGFKTADGAFVGGSLRDVARVYGWFGAMCRAPMLALLERDLAPDTLLMDGIFVSAHARGQCIGTRLLDAIKTEATARRLPHVRLDVIDTNPRARALYERQGFIATGTERLGLLRHLFGFDHATEMRWTAPPGPDATSGLL